MHLLSCVAPMGAECSRAEVFVVDGRLQCCVQGSSLTDIDGGVAVVDTVQLCAMQVCTLKSIWWRSLHAIIAHYDPVLQNRKKGEYYEVCSAERLFL